MLITPSALASALGISRQMVYRHERDGKIQRGDGGFDLEQVRRQLAENLRGKQGGSPRGGKTAPAADPTESGRSVLVECEPQPHGGWLKREHAVEEEIGPNSLAAAQKRKEFANARKAEVHADRLEGKFADLAEVKLMASSLVASAKTRLRGIGNKIAPLVAIESDAAACQVMIDAEVDEALTELAQWEPQAA
jgi:hypothetical protein